MSDDRIDLSELDPSRNQQRWERLVQSVASRGFAARKRRATVSYQLLLWTRPALAIAATIALVVWAGALVSSNRPSETTVEEPAYTLARWASDDNVPSPTEILKVFGERNGTQ